jgi:hypothetical protein
MRNRCRAAAGHKRERIQNLLMDHGERDGSHGTFPTSPHLHGSREPFSRSFVVFSLGHDKIENSDKLRVRLHSNQETTDFQLRLCVSYVLQLPVHCFNSFTVLAAFWNGELRSRRAASSSPAMQLHAAHTLLHHAACCLHFESHLDNRRAPATPTFL